MKMLRRHHLTCDQPMRACSRSEGNYIPLPGLSKKAHPTEVGHHASTGLCQLIPEIRYLICAGKIAITPSAGNGHRNRPFASCFTNRAGGSAVMPDHLDEIAAPISRQSA